MLLVRCADCGWRQRVAIGTLRAAWGRCQRLGCGSKDLRLERTPEGWPRGMNRVQDRRQLSEKGRPGVEVYSGDDWSRDLGRWVKRTIVIDRLAVRYPERVVDPDTGGVLHEKVKPLGEHHRVMAVIAPPPEPPPLDSQ